jgi:hypothetical protein
MKRLILCAAAFALTTFGGAQANAATYLTYTATGTGSYSVTNLLTLESTSQTVLITATLTVLPDLQYAPFAPCWPGSACSKSGNIISGINDASFTKVSLTFDHDVSGAWPTTADGFVSGSASLNLPVVGVNSTHIGGTLTSLTITTFDADPLHFPDTGPGLAYSFVPVDPGTSVPELGSWTLMIAGLAIVGASMRRWNHRLVQERFKARAQA